MFLVGFHPSFSPLGIIRASPALPSLNEKVQNSCKSSKNLLKTTLRRLGFRENTHLYLSLAKPGPEISIGAGRRQGHFGKSGSAENDTTVLILEERKIPLRFSIGAVHLPCIVKNPRIWLPAILTSAITGPLATCVFHFEMNDPASGVASGMGTCGLVGQIGVYTGWVNDVASGAKAAVTGMDWLGLVLISFVLPAVLTWLIAIPLRKWGWIKDGDLKLDL